MMSIKREGQAGQEWLDALPWLVDDLLDRWNCAQDGDLRHGGVGIVVPVARSAREHQGLVSSSRQHRRVGSPGRIDGRGAVRLYDVDEDKFAMLLERIHPRDLSTVQDVDEALRLAPKGMAGTACFDAATVVRHQLLDIVLQPRLADMLAHRVALFSETAAVDFDLAMRCTRARFVSSYCWELRYQPQEVVVNAMRAASIAAAMCFN